jgi:ABC-2 type transport system ATP-binding protein
LARSSLAIPRAFPKVDFQFQYQDHLQPNEATAMQLTIENLSKTYPGGVRALDQVSLTIPSGMFGLLGPNGAGKSTLMRTLATLQEADSGQATLEGTPRAARIDMLKEKNTVRKLLGYLPQEFGVYPRTSAVKLLSHLAALKGVGAHSKERLEVVDALLERVNLSEHRHKAVSNYSGGMRQRFGIAQALLGDPQLLIVDEPTAGLDPGERNRFYNLLAEVGENIIVILSTHIVQDVKELCTNMAIIDKGRLLANGAPADAESQLAGKVWSMSMSKPELQHRSWSYPILSTKLVGGLPSVRIYSDQRCGCWREYAPQLAIFGRYVVCRSKSDHGVYGRCYLRLVGLARFREQDVGYSLQQTAEQMGLSSGPIQRRDPDRTGASPRYRVGNSSRPILQRSGYRALGTEPILASLATVSCVCDSQHPGFWGLGFCCR